jgi:hypothetical protein
MISTRKLISLSVLLALCVSASAFAVDVPVDISGVRSMGLIGDPLNDKIVLDLAALIGIPSGSTVELKSASYDIILTTIAPSWADEPRIDIGGLATLGPFGTATTVTSAPFAGGTAVPGGGPNGGTLIPGGMITLEFYETGFDDHSFTDAFYGSTSSLNLAVNVPEPACIALILMGLGMLCLGRRR